MVAAEYSILIDEMDQNKVCRNQKLKAFYLSIIFLIATVVLMLVVTNLPNRISRFKFEKKIEKSILVDNSNSTKYFHTLKDIQDFIWHN